MGMGKLARLEVIKQVECKNWARVCFKLINFDTFNFNPKAQPQWMILKVPSFSKFWRHLCGSGRAGGGTPSITSLLLQISTLWEKKTIQPEERWFSQYFITTKQKGEPLKTLTLSPERRPGVWGMICLIYLWRLWAAAIHHNYAGPVSRWPRARGTSLSQDTVTRPLYHNIDRMVNNPCFIMFYKWDISIFDFHHCIDNYNHQGFLLTG